MKVAKCLFDNGLKAWTLKEATEKGLKTYSFYIPENLNEVVEEGCTVVVWTANNLQIVKVVEVREDDLDEDTSKAFQYILSVVDVQAEKNRQAAKTKKALLLKRLTSREAELRDMEKFRELAKIDKVSATLVEELEKLEN